MSLNKFIASARELKEVNQDIKISVIKDLSEASNYTDKKNCAIFEWSYSEKNVEKLIEYIKEHLKICPRIELWNTTNSKDNNAIVRKCSKLILNKDYIKEIWGKESVVQPECLVVYNS